MVGVIRGFDELRNAQGVLVAPLGFGHQSDWEIIERIEVTAAVGTVDLDLNGAGFDPTLYDEYEITISGLTHSADGGLHCRTSTDGGSTYDAGASDYSWIVNRVAHDPGEFSNRVGDDASTFMVIGDVLGASTNEVSSWRIWCGQLDDGKHKSFVYQGTGRISDTNGYSYWGGGMRESTTDINGIQFHVGAGNIDGGVFTLRGRRKVPAAFVNQSDWEVITDAETVAAAATHDYFWDDDAYDEIEITLTGVRVGTDIQNLEARLSSDGSTFHSGATDYKTTFYNFNDSGVGGASAESSTGAAQIKLAADLGTGTDEYMDGVIHLTGVSNSSRKKKGTGRFSGLISDASNQSMNTSFIDMNTNARCQGIQLRGEGSTTVAFDRVRIRGRRKAPGGAAAAGSGDFKHLGDFNVATPGDTFIDVDMRESINSQFTSDFQDTDFLFMLSGSIGPSNATLHFRVVRDGTQQSGASDYKSDNSNGANNIRMTASTPGTGRKIVARGHLFRYNNAASTAFFGVTGESFSADSGGTREPLGFWGGHANGLPSGLNNGFRVYCSAGDMDDITISVYGFKRSQT
jgi:hypothetical protein